MSYVDISVADPDLDAKDNCIRSVRVRDLELEDIYRMVDPFQPANRIRDLRKRHYFSAANSAYILSNSYLD